VRTGRGVPVLALATVLVLVAAGCGSGDGGPSGDTGQTYPVQVDGDAPDHNVAVAAYFPRAIQAHAGDKVEFTLADSGDPHTVTLGSLVDTALGDDAGDRSDEEEEEQEAALARLPALLTPAGTTVQAAAQPCFLATGRPPAEEACTEQQQEQPEFDGRQPYYNSGWVAPDDVFSVTLADDIEPGTYRFFCLLHREAMAGHVTVVADQRAVPSPRQVADRGNTELAAALADLEPAVARLATATPDAALAGVAVDDPDVPARLTEFAPRQTTVGVGDALSWTVTGGHTISFNAPPDAARLLARDADGVVHVNPKAVIPANRPTQPTPAAGSPPPPVPVITGGRFDGSRFVSSGLLGVATPVRYQLTFTRAGTFAYQCLVHPGMDGTVTVS